MKIQNTIMAGLVLGGVTLGGASMGGATVKSAPVMANNDNISITLPNSGHADRAGQTVVNVLSNDSGSINKHNIKLYNPVTNKASNNFKIGKTTYNFHKGVLRVSYSGLSKVSDFKTISYTVTAKDGLSTSMAQVSFSISQLADPVPVLPKPIKPIVTKTHLNGVAKTSHKASGIPAHRMK